MGRCFTELQNQGVGSSVIKTKKQCTSVAAILKQAESVGLGVEGDSMLVCFAILSKRLPAVFGCYFKTGSSRS